MMWYEMIDKKMILKMILKMKEPSNALTKFFSYILCCSHGIKATPVRTDETITKIVVCSLFGKAE